MIVNTKVKAVLPCDGKKSVQFEDGIIIYIGVRALVQFNSHVCGHDGNGIGKPRHCWMMDWDKLEERG